MLIFNNLNDINAVSGILEKVANEVNDYRWQNNNSVDYERASALRDLEDYLISHGYIDKSYDLAKLTYNLLDLYPQSIQAQENNRQYHEVLNKLSDNAKSTLLWDIRNMEKDTGEKVDKSIKFNMALERLLGERESEIVESYEE
jgi:hypothetical protein